MTTIGSDRLPVVRRALEAAVRAGELDSREAAKVLEHLVRDAAPAGSSETWQKRRAEIIDSAADVFRLAGYNRATLEDIAERLTLSKAALYHYFSSKNEILEAICDDAMTSAQRAVRSGLASTDDPILRIREALLRYSAVLLGRAELSVLVQNFGELDSDARARQEGKRKSIELELAEAIEEAVRLGNFKLPDPRISVYVALGAINWLYSWYEPDGRLSPQAICQLIVDQIMTGLVGESGPREGERSANGR